MNDLYVQVGYGGGLTSLLDAYGKPVLTPKLQGGGGCFEKE